MLLRTWSIDHPGPNDQDPGWSPQRLAADTVATLSLTLTLTSSAARGLADHGRKLTIEQLVLRCPLPRHRIGTPGAGPTSWSARRPNGLGSTGNWQQLKRPVHQYRPLNHREGSHIGTFCP